MRERCQQNQLFRWGFLRARTPHVGRISVLCCKYMLAWVMYIYRQPVGMCVWVIFSVRPTKYKLRGVVIVVVAAVAVLIHLARFSHATS